MDSKAVHILLVDNDNHHTELLRRAFKSRSGKKRLKVVTSLKEAHRYLNQTVPDLVIADMRLPDGEGIELQQQEAPYPVIVMTSQGDEEAVVDAMKTGALECILKSEQTMADMPRFAERALREWKALNQRKQSEKLQNLQKKVLEKIVAGDAIAGILDTLCLQVQEIVPGSICSVMTLEESTGLLHVFAAPSAPETLFAALNGLLPGEQAASCGTAAYTGEPVFVEDTEVDPRWSGFLDVARKLAIRGCWSIPIVSEKKKIWGTFAIAHSHPCSPTAFDCQLLEIASYMAGITIQRREAEERLRSNEERYRDLYESAPLAYFTSRMNGQIIGANIQATHLLGYPKKELLSRSLLDLCAPTKNGRDKAQHLLDQSQHDHEVEGEELEMQRADGTRIWVSLTVRLIRDANGNPIERRAIVQDITMRKVAQERLQLTKFVVDHAGEAIFWAGPDKTILYANEEAYRSLGYQSGELLGRPISEISPTHDSERFRNRLEQLREHQTIRYESYHRTKEGKDFPIEITLSALEHENETYTCAIVRDITTHKRRQDLLAKQNSILEMIATGNPLSEVLTHICKLVEGQSDGLLCSIHLLEGNILRQGGAPSLPERYRRKVDQITIGPSAGSCGTAAYRKQAVIVSDIATDPLWERGRRLALDHGLRACWSTPILSSDGSVLGTFAMYYHQPHAPTSEDSELIKISTSLARIAIEHRKAQEALQISEERYRALYNDNPTMYFTIGSDGTILSVNQFGAQQLGYSVQELIGQPVFKVFYAEDQVRVRKEFHRCLQHPDEIFDWEFRKIRKDGSLFWVKEIARVAESPHEGLVVLIVCEDISERKSAEEKLLASQQGIRELYEIISWPEASFEHRTRLLLELGCRRFKLPIGLLIRQVGEELELVYVRSKTPELTEGRRFPVSDTFCSAALQAKGPICFEHAALTEWKTHPGYAALKLEAYLGTKLFMGNDVYGTFCFVDYEPHRSLFTEADKDFLQLMARWLSGELERQRAETDLRTQHALLNAVIEGTTDAFFVKDPQGRYLMMNAAGTRFMGKTVHDVIGKSDDDLFPPETASRLRQYDHDILASGETRTFEEEATVDGTTRYYLTTKGVYRDSQGKVLGVFGNSHDITQRKKTEDQVHEMNLALTNAMPGISHVSPDGLYTRVNDMYAGMLGYDPTDLIGTSWVLTVHAEDLALAKDAYEVMLSSGKGEFEARAVRKDGSAFYNHVLLVKQVDRNGNSMGHHRLMRDISDRKYSEEALRESESRLHAVLDNSSAVIYVKDLQGQYLLINQTYEKLFNVDRESVKGKTDFDIFPFALAKAFTENDQKVRESGEPLEREEVAPHHDGLHTYISSRFLLKNAQGVPYAICGISTDITQRKQAENNIRLHSHILASSPNGILITDPKQPDNPIIYCNSAFENITGYSSSEILGWNCRFLHRGDREQEGLHKLRAAMQAQQGCQVVLRNYKKDGTLFWNDLRLAPVFNDQGELINYIGVQVDITERKTIEDALRLIAETSATLSGLEFFHFLVKTLAQCLNMKYVFMTECVDSTREILRTIAFWDGTNFGQNFAYNISHTPCERVMKGEICFLPNHAQQQFPDDEDLKTMEVESYVGYPLFSQSGNIFGHLVAMDVQPLSEHSQAIPIVKLFAARAAAEFERHKTEEALRRSEGRLRQVIDLVPHFIFAKDKEGRFILGNEAVAKVYGTTVPSLIGKTDADFARSPEEAERFRRDDLRVIESNQVKTIKEEQITDASGHVHYLQTIKIPFVFADTVLPSVLGVAIDITEQKMVERRLREAYASTRELTARLEAAEESERKRLARELHDEFGQMLTGLKFDLAWVGRRLSQEKGGAPLKALFDKIQSMSQLTDDMIQTVRRIATSLRPSILDDLGLVPALEWQAKEFQGRTGIPCKFTAAPELINYSFDADRATALFRIAQELCTNILRHADASCVKLDLRKEAGAVVLTVQDNGRGISEREISHPTSLGLLGIKERAGLFKGTLLISGKPGRGTCATVRIPLP